MRSAAAIAIALLACGCAARRGSEQQPAARASQWFEDKETVSFSYQRGRWERISRLDPRLKPYRSKGFEITCGENGGRTRNFVGCTFRVSPDAVRKHRRLHARLTGMGFTPGGNSPTVITYRVAPEVRQRARREIEACQKRIVKKLSARLPQLAGLTPECIGKAGIRYFHCTVSRKYHVSLRVQDLSARLGFDRLSFVPDLTVHLPRYGYYLELYVILLDQAAKGRFAEEEAAAREIVKKELAPLVAGDGKALVRPARQLGSPFRVVPVTPEISRACDAALKRMTLLSRVEGKAPRDSIEAARRLIWRSVNIATAGACVEYRGWYFFSGLNSARPDDGRFKSGLAVKKGTAEIHRWE
jgi:hypothetical protein